LTLGLLSEDEEEQGSSCSSAIMSITDPTSEFDDEDDVQEEEEDFQPSTQPIVSDVVMEPLGQQRKLIAVDMTSQAQMFTRHMQGRVVIMDVFG
jgi:hypothetical protein